MFTRKISSKKHDYLYLDDSDIDLEAIFGEDFTESEEGNNSEFSENSDSTDDNNSSGIECVDCDKDFEDAKLPKTSRSKSKKSKPTKQYMYQCDQCGAKMTSISGIRGHMTKKHNKLSLRASDYRIDAERSRIATMLSKEDYPGVVMHARDNIVKGIYSKQLSESSRIIHNVNISAPVDAIASATQDSMLTLIETLQGKSSTMAAREHMFSEFHKLRCNTDFNNKLMPIFQQNRACVQIWLRELLNSCLQILGKKCQEQITTPEVTLTDNDQTVLYHICGYLLKCVKKTSFRSSPFMKQSIGSNESTYIHKYGKWTSVMDRGGLTYPSDSMFKLIRACEYQIRKTVITENINHDSLKIAPLKEGIIESYAIQAEWEKLCVGMSDSDSLKLFELVIGKFIVVRGFAVTRLLRKQRSKEAKNQTKQKALRKTLKDKSSSGILKL